jgi:Bacterial Ig domain
MVGSIFRTAGTILVIAVGLVVAFPATSTPASAQTDIEALVDFSGANLSGANTAVNQPPVTAVLIPSNGAAASGATALLDASASSAVGIASVTFEVSGGALSDQVVATATPTYYGWLAQWNTTAVPNGTYSLQSVATDTVAETTTSSPITVTVDNPAPTTTVVIPSNGATQSGTAALLDASASANVTSVRYELTGGTLTDQVIATATPTYYGWLAQWNTTTVPNGTYTLQSVAAYAGGVTGTSPGVSVTVNNLPLQTQVLVPSSGTTVGGNVVLDAVAEGTAPITGVTFTATQGSTVETVGTATPTIYGWIAQWASGVSPNNGTLAYPSGTWSIRSVATEVGGTTAMSSPVQITLVTLGDLVSSSTFILTGANFCGGSLVPDEFSGTYSGSTSVGTVNLAFNGCLGFTLTTDSGSVSGSTAIVTENSGPSGTGTLWALQVTTGTGLFTGTTGDSLFFNSEINNTGPFTGSVGLSP